MISHIFLYLYHILFLRKNNNSHNFQSISYFSANIFNKINHRFFYNKGFDISRFYQNHSFSEIQEDSQNKLYYIFGPNIKLYKNCFDINKVDIIFSNPPYNRNIHIKILNNILDNSLAIVLFPQEEYPSIAMIIGFINFSFYKTLAN